MVGRGMIRGLWVSVKRVRCSGDAQTSIVGIAVVVWRTENVGHL